MDNNLKEKISNLCKIKDFTAKFFILYLILFTLIYICITGLFLENVNIYKVELYEVGLFLYFFISGYLVGIFIGDKLTNAILECKIEMLEVSKEIYDKFFDKNIFEEYTVYDVFNLEKIYEEKDDSCADIKYYIYFINGDKFNLTKEEYFYLKENKNSILCRNINDSENKLCII